MVMGARLDSAAQRQAGVDCFNLVWELLAKPERTPAETDRMIHAAHASRFRRLAREAGEQIQAPQDRQPFEEDLATVPTVP